MNSDEGLIITRTKQRRKRAPRDEIRHRIGSWTRLADRSAPLHFEV